MVDRENDLAFLLSGNVVARAFEGLQHRLKQVFKEPDFRHLIISPSATKDFWEKVTLSKEPYIGLGLHSWQINNNAGYAFMGDLRFTVLAVLKHNRSRDLYLGNGQLRGWGAAGVMALGVGALHGWTLPEIGRCKISKAELPATFDWFNDRAAIVGFEVSFENVTLDTNEWLSNLDEFLKLGETWNVDGSDTEPMTLNVRENDNGI